LAKIDKSTAIQREKNHSEEEEKTMIHTAPKAKLTWTLICVCTALLLFSGCSYLQNRKASSKPSGATAQPKNIYLDFGDVLLPRQLEVDRDNSFVFSTAGLTAGLLSLKGRVEGNSMISYFENKMPVDGWQMISAIKSARSMLLFKKQARWCVISITEGQLYTYVEIWVAPTMGGVGPQPESGLMKPQGHDVPMMDQGIPLPEEK
jgi:hypothetical protein